MRLYLAIAALLCAWASQAQAAEGTVPVFALESKWTSGSTRHETSAEDIYSDAKYIYVASPSKPPVNAKMQIGDGAVCWTHPAEGFQPSYPVSNGQVVVYGTHYYKAKIVALDDLTGKVLWEMPTGQQIGAAPAISDNVAYVSSSDRCVYAVELSSGKLLWKAGLGAGSRSRPLVLGNQIVVGCDDGYLYFIDSPSGKVTKKLDSTGVVWGGPVLANKLIFVVAGTLPIGRPGRTLSRQDDQNLVKKARSRMLVIDPSDGRIIDEFKTDRGYEFASRVLISGDRAFFFDHRTLYSYDTKLRKLIWKLDAPRVHPSPVLAGQYVLLPMNPTGVEGQHQHRLVVIDASDGRILREQESGGQGLNLCDHYAQCGDTVILTSPMQAYSIRQQQ